MTRTPTRTTARRQPPSPAERSGNLGPVFGLIAAVLVALVVAVLTVGESGDTDTSGPSSARPGTAGAPTGASALGYGTVAVDGTPLPRLPDGATPDTDPAVGAPAPRLLGRTLDDREVVLGDGPALIAFLAHWCSHCQSEVPQVVDWLDEARLPDGVALAAVATSTDPGMPNFPPEDWLRRERWSVPAILDEPSGTAATAYGVTRFPFWVAIDADGNVVARVTGVLAADQLDVLAAGVAP